MSDDLRLAWPPSDPSWDVPPHERHELSAKGSRWCVLVPVINEGDRILGQLAAMAATSHGCDVVVADGGSTDGSMALDGLRDRAVRTLLVKRGAGRLSAQLRMGMAYAVDEGYEGVITIDGNGKDDVAGIPRLVGALAGGADFVQGSRFRPGGQAINTPASRFWAIKVIHAPVVSLAARHRYTDTTNGFRGHARRLLIHPEVRPFRSVFDTYELLAYLPIRAARLGLRCVEVPVTRRYPEGEVPTKIHGWRGNAALLGIVVRAALGRYDP